MSARNFDRVEELLDVLLNGDSVLFNEAEVAEIRAFILNREYGIAFDLIVDTIVEDMRTIPKQWLPTSRELSRLMELDSDAYEKRLRPFIAG